MCGGSRCRGGGGSHCFTSLGFFIEDSFKVWVYRAVILINLIVVHVVAVC